MIVTYMTLMLIIYKLSCPVAGEELRGEACDGVGHDCFRQALRWNPLTPRWCRYRMGHRVLDDWPGLEQRRLEQQVWPYAYGGLPGD